MKTTTSLLNSRDPRDPRDPRVPVTWRSDVMIPRQVSSQLYLVSSIGKEDVLPRNVGISATVTKHYIYI